MSHAPDDPPKPDRPHRGSVTSDLRHASLSALTGAGLPSVDALLREQVLSGPGRLEVDEKIAQGGMATIMRALDRTLARDVAMKILAEHHSQDRVAIQMLIREAQITGHLEHPNIVPIHDLAVDTSGRLHFTMKLVEGRTLGEIIAALPPAPLPASDLFDLLDVVIKVCDALGLAHSRGIVHCDIKPDNVMVGQFGEVYLMDWGVAQVLEGGNESGARRQDVREQDIKRDSTMVGTLVYMSPEQALGRLGDLSERTDVFGVGGLLYEILSRRAPHAGHGYMRTVGFAQEGVITPLAEVIDAADLPAGLTRITMRALAREPEARFSSAHELKRALLEFMRGPSDPERRRFAPGEHIVREGEPGDVAYIIERGHCEVLREVEGRTHSLRIMGPGEIFGETAILSPGPRTASVVAVDDVVAQVITAEEIERQTGSLRPWMGRLIRTLAERFREADAARKLD